MARSRYYGKGTFKLHTRMNFLGRSSFATGTDYIEKPNFKCRFDKQLSKIV